MRIRATWDSSPYGIYYVCDEVGSVEVPESVWLRYLRADEELTAARDALDDALHGTLPDGSVPYDEIGPSKESLERMDEMEDLIKLDGERECQQ